MVPQRTAVQCANRRGRNQALVFVANGLAGQGANVKHAAQKRITNRIGRNVKKRFACSPLAKTRAPQSIQLQRGAAVTPRAALR